MPTVLKFPVKAPARSAEPPRPDAAKRNERYVQRARMQELSYGPNAYTRFVLKHGCLPAPGQAATIAKVIGGRVPASDGKLYPPLTKAQRARRREQLAKLKLDTKTGENAGRIIASLQYLHELSTSAAPPAEVVAYLARSYDAERYRSQIREHLPAADWLREFAKEWDRHEQQRYSHAPGRASEL